MYINKEMIDEERYNLLKNKMLSVVKWDKSKEIQITDPDESISHAIRRHANELGIIGQKLQLEGMEIYPVFTMKAVKESESIMRKRNENIADLSKLFTVLPAVAKNAILLEIEEYRHMSSRRPTDIFNMSHYLSGFHDGDLFYPVKISVSNRSDNNNTSIKMTITVGKISLSTFEKEKRSETDTNMHSMNEESSSVCPLLLI